MPRILSTTSRFFIEKEQRTSLMLYGAIVLLWVHGSLVVYINSTYLETFISSKGASFVYAIGSVFLLLSYFIMPHLLRRYGAYKLILVFTLFELLALCGLAFASSIFLIIPSFLAHFVVVPLIVFNLDIFIEKRGSKKEGIHTGSRRGLYLSLISLAAAVAPLLTGNLLSATNDNFSAVYIAGALFMIPFVGIIMFFFRNFQDPMYSPFSLSSMGKAFTTEPDTRNIIIISFFLQLFFTWTVIYMPLYLSTVVGFSWAEIGSIMFVGLMAYVIFEYPIGIIADRYIGEKEMMAFGFLLIAVSTSWFAFLMHASIGVWMLAMFLTRAGASFVEATSESYFFKKTESTQTHKLGLFRMTRPLASVVGAIIGSISLLFMDFNLIFILIAFLMIPGLFFTILLKDTQ